MNTKLNSPRYHEFIERGLKFFELTEEHLFLFSAMCIGWNDVEFGAPFVDPKRPYGNSSVEYDIAEILYWDVPIDGLTNEQMERAREIHKEMKTALEVVLQVQHFEPGLYVTSTGYVWIPASESQIEHYENLATR